RRSDLQRVVPIAQRLRDHLTVVSLELYADAVVVRYIDDRGMPRNARELDGRAFVLTDNIGTTYHVTDGASHMSEGLGSAVLGEHIFAPSVPSGADALRALAKSAEVAIP